jgi:hypothetical protein
MNGRGGLEPYRWAMRDQARRSVPMLDSPLD